MSDMPDTIWMNGAMTLFKTTPPITKADEREFKKYIRADLVPQCPEWQPIETAPRDGSKILIFCNEEIYAAYWDSEFKSEWDDEKDDSFYVGAWTDNAILSFAYEETNSYEPTHWMPLPAAPKPPAGGE